jgi:hypothetical protein
MTESLYHIRVKGHLDDSWGDWFEGMLVTNHENGEATIEVHLPDQAALQGILNRIGSIGLSLISVNRATDEADPNS